MTKTEPQVGGWGTDAGDDLASYEGWSVVIIGGLLAGVAVGGSFLGGDGVDRTRVAVPLVASLAIVAAGVRLRRVDLSDDDIAIVAIWTALTAALFAAVVMVAAYVMAENSLQVGSLIASFMAPLGACGGAVAGYSDARRRQQHRQSRRTERALESATDGIAILDEEGTYVRVNQAHTDVYGYDDPDEMVGQTWETCYGDEELERMHTDVMPQLESQGEWRGEATGRRADGTSFPQELTLTSMDSGGRVCIVRDISERREQEERLREQKRKLGTIVENVPIILFAFDQTGTLTLSEGKGLDALGLESGELVGESVFDVYADAPAVVDGCRQALDGETVHRTLYLGDAVLETWMTPSFDEDGSVSQVIGTSMDMTEQHEQEQEIAALHNASRRLTYATTFEEVAETAIQIIDELLDGSLSAVWRYDEDTETLRQSQMNDDMATLADETGVAFDTLEETSFGMDCFRSGQLRVIDDYSSFEQAAFPDLELGTVVLVPIDTHGLLQVGYRESTDIDDLDRTQLGILRLNLQAALARAEREALLRERTEELEATTAQMAFINSILRHDVLNGMTVIRARGEFLEAELEGKQREYAETIVRWCDDITSFVERVQTVLNALSGEGGVPLRPVDAAELLREEIERIDQTYPEVTFTSSLDDEVTVLADELLGDVLGNIVRNAIEHNETEGLRIRVNSDTHDDTVTVRIADNGRGIPAEQREAVFRRGETHAKSTGSGFGLFFVDAMVEAYGGDVRIEDAPAEHFDDDETGAVFAVELRRPNDQRGKSGDDV